MNGGALVLPVLHEVICVNMNTLRLEVKREKHDSLITKDKMRVDVGVEFYVRVNPTEEAIATAAQTLGSRTLNAGELRALIEGKFVAALRACAAQMDMGILKGKMHRFSPRRHLFKILLHQFWEIPFIKTHNQNHQQAIHQHRRISIAILRNI